MSDSQKEKKTLVSDFTSGSILRPLLFFTAPLFLSNLMQVLYNVADMAIVGQINGQDGLAAVTVGGDITNCLTMIMVGFATAVQVVISQYLGAGQKEKIGRFLGSASIFFLTSVLCISCVCIVLRKYLLLWMSTPEETFAQTEQYLIITLCGLVFICGYNIVSAVFRGLGDSRHPFIFITAASVMNIILDIVLVGGFSMGAAGAAYATVVAQAASFISALVFLYRNRESLGFVMTARDFKPAGDMIRLLLKQGLPLALKSAAVQISRLFMNSFINSYGTVVCAASGVTAKINNIANLLANSLNTSGASMVSQNIGAEKYDRVTRILSYMIKITVPLAILQTIVMLAWPEAVFGIFSSEADVLAVCMDYVPIAILNFASCAVRATMNALINGSGNYKINYMVALLDAIILRIALGLTFGLLMGMGYVGFWLGDALASFTPCVIGTIFLISGKWKNNRYIIDKR